MPSSAAAAAGGGVALRHAIEVRHESFRNAEFIDIARRHGVAVVTRRMGSSR